MRIESNLVGSWFVEEEEEEEGEEGEDGAISRTDEEMESRQNGEGKGK